VAAKKRRIGLLIRSIKLGIAKLRVAALGGGNGDFWRRAGGLVRVERPSRRIGSGVAMAAWRKAARKYLSASKAAGTAVIA